MTEPAQTKISYNTLRARLVVAILVLLSVFSMTVASSNAPQPPAPITILISDITDQGVANKSDYVRIAERPEDVYVCTHIACRQAEWIADNYGYGTGVVMLWSYVNDSHARTWVEIDNETYVIESINDHYWAEDEHERVFSDQFEIEFVTTAQGWIHAIESSEAFCASPRTDDYTPLTAHITKPLYAIATDIQQVNQI